MRSLDDVLSRLRALQPDLRRRYPIRSMGVFGSYVRGEQRKDSDVDVLVELGEGMDLIAYAGLQQELSDALGMPVDLVEREALKPASPLGCCPSWYRCETRCSRQPCRHAGIRPRCPGVRRGNDRRRIRRRSQDPIRDIACIGGYRGSGQTRAARGAGPFRKFPGGRSSECGTSSPMTIWVSVCHGCSIRQRHSFPNWWSDCRR